MATDMRTGGAGKEGGGGVTSFGRAHSVRHVLITGGRGQLGTELQRLLRRAGVSYEALDLPELDITDEPSVQAAVARAAVAQAAVARAAVAQAAEQARAGEPRAAGQTPAVAAGLGTALVIHAAAFTAVDRAEDAAQRDLVERVNVTGTRHVARACARAGLPLVYVSTDFVFGGDKRVPYEADDEPAPLSVYGATKLAGEQAVRELCPQHYIVRTAWVYGVYGRNFPRAILGAAAAAGPKAQLEPLRVVNDQVGCPTYAHDLAEAILLLAGVPVVQPEGVRLLAGPERMSGGACGRADGVGAAGGAGGGAGAAVLLPPAAFGTYHVTNGGSCSWREFAGEIVRLAGWSVPVKPISSAELNRPARRPAYSVLSAAKLRTVGLELRPWPEALRAFLAELRTDSPDLFPGEEKTK